jgi:muramoyltetrapeptide carboxypeptidase
MNIIKPEKIKNGETICIIAPSGNVDKDKILNSAEYFKSLGYKVKFGKNVFNQDRYLAGKDEERISDLEEAFNDKDVNAIICARGGYGALRIAEKINYNIIRNNPKIFCGYSDITALSLMILKRTGLVTYSSPMPKGDFQPEQIDEFTQKHFWLALKNELNEITAEELKTYKDGSATGILWGGNLSTIVSLCGLDFIPDKKFIFFTEDLNEPVYKIDRCFRQLLNIEKFRKNIAGIVLGDFLDIEYPQQLDELFDEIARELNIPVYGGYKITHGKSKLTIPIGINAHLNNGKINL